MCLHLHCGPNYSQMNKMMMVITIIIITTAMIVFLECVSMWNMLMMHSFSIVSRISSSKFLTCPLDSSHCLMHISHKSSHNTHTKKLFLSDFSPSEQKCQVEIRLWILFIVRSKHNAYVKDCHKQLCGWQFNVEQTNKIMNQNKTSNKTTVTKSPYGLNITELST